MPNLSELANSKINPKRSNFFVVFLVSTLLLTIALGLSPSSVQAQSERFKISGHVLDSNGLGIAKADVIFNVPSIVPGVFTDNSGYYETYGPSGIYHLNVWPPYDSNYINYDEAGFTVVSDVTKNITLQTAIKISGYVIDSVGTPMVGASVLFKTTSGVYGSGYFTTNSGYYFINVPAGTYTIDAHPQTAFNPSYTGPCTPFPTYYEYNFVVSVNMNKNITVGGTAPTITPTPPAPPSNGSNLDDWLMYRHDVQRIGSTTSTASAGNLLWQFNTGDKIRSSPAIVNGVVYEGSNNGIIYALNATNGSLIWQYNSGSQVESSAAVANGVVYVGILWDGHNGYVIALNANTGSLIWRFLTNSGIESSPTVVNDTVYIGSFNGYIYALNATNGALIWSYFTGSSTFSSPSIVNGVLYQGADNGNVYALNANNGTLIWSYQTGSQVYSTPAIVDNVAYVCSDFGTVYALKVSDGSRIWQASIGSGTDHSDDSPAVANGMVYIGARNGYYALNATDGKQIWFFTSPYSARQLQGYVYSSPAVSGNVVYFGSCDSYVFALNAFNGSMIWAYRTGGFLFASPSVVNGVLYIGSYDGNIYALGTPINSPAPISQATTTPSPTPSPTPTTAPTQLPTPQPKVNPIPASTTNQAPSEKNQMPPNPTTNLSVESIRDEPINWYILGGIIVIAALALISLYVTFTKTD
jgi:outer membrane protein assembly factor BamB